MLIRRLAIQLNSDDLPTFGRPTIATVGTATVETPGRGPSDPQVRANESEGIIRHAAKPCRRPVAAGGRGWLSFSSIRISICFVSWYETPGGRSETNRIP